MNILLTNDDGILAEGIYELAKELEKYHNVMIVAPHEENSAKSHSITIYETLEVKEVKLDGLKSKAYSVTGTPADCVRIAMDQLVDPKDIDIVISGTNKGLNAGMDVLYSGTVSAAIEGNIQNLPAIAVSAEYKNDTCNFKRAASCAVEVLDMVLKHEKVNEELLLNLNVPYLEEDEDIKGIKICKLGEAVYDYFKVDTNGNNNGTSRSFKIMGREEKEFQVDTDRYYLEMKYATITPLKYNMTNEIVLKEMLKWYKIK